MFNRELQRLVVDVREVFMSYDSLGDDCILAKDIGTVLRALGLYVTESEVAKCSYNDTPNARINYETFLPIYSGLLKQQIKVNKSQFIEAFRVFDKDDNGFISAAELRHLLTALGESLRDDEVDILISGLENGQGAIPYEAFVNRVMSV